MGSGHKSHTRQDGRDAVGYGGSGVGKQVVREIWTQVGMEIWGQVGREI